MTVGQNNLACSLIIVSAAILKGKTRDLAIKVSDINQKYVMFCKTSKKDVGYIAEVCEHSIVKY